jgi:mono/diheme cytochrome c family protein
MPDFSPTLSDADIAEVVSFVRGAWGNQASAVGAQEVAALRQSLKAPGFAAGQMSNKH